MIPIGKWVSAICNVICYGEVIATSHKGIRRTGMGLVNGSAYSGQTETKCPLNVDRD
jgi:hypothetical protein